MARPILPWARRHVARVARRYHTGESDLWDETITALLRAAVYFDPIPPAGTGGGRDGSAYNVAKAFGAYARLAINRACWRYVCRQLNSPNRPYLLAIVGSPVDAHTPETLAEDHAHFGTGYVRDGIHGDEVDLDGELAWHSTEDEVMAREAVWLRSSPTSSDCPSAARCAKSSAGHRGR